MYLQTRGERRWIDRPSFRFALCGLVTAIVLSSGAWAQSPRLIADRFIVTFKAEAGEPVRAAEQLAQSHGFRVRNVYQHALRGMVIDLPEPAQQHVLDALRQNPNVESVVQDRIITLAAEAIPKGVVRVGAEGYHNRANAGAGVRVAVMDSGIDFEHLDLQGNIDTAHSVQCLGGNPCATGGDDEYGHGTSVAGVIAAVDNNNLNIVGVAPSATLISVKVFDASGNSSSAAVLAGVDYLTGLNESGIKTDVVNMSFVDWCKDSTGAYIDCQTDPDQGQFYTAIEKLISSGTTVVAAAGNEKIDTKFVVPASFPGVIAVSALADSDGLPGGIGADVCLTRFLFLCLEYVPDDHFAPFSNFGERVDVIAPGADELLLQNGGGTRNASGTSFAAPHAAGVAAIFISDRLAKGQQAPLPDTVKQALVTTGECYATGADAGQTPWCFRMSSDLARRQGYLCRAIGSR